jgi:riboflavin synthase
MFTGIVEEVGIVARVEPREAGSRLRIRCQKVMRDAFEGASISVNGVCLTAVDLQPDSFGADVSPESLLRSNLGELQAGSAVNLERPLSPTGRFGGHIMQGHVDGVGQLESLDLLGDENWWLRVRVPPEVERYVVFKGSIGINGLSLTVAELEGDIVSVTIIPHTWKHTTLSRLQPGARLNIECDVLAKYVEKMLGRSPGRASEMTLERLEDLGY